MIISWLPITFHEAPDASSLRLSQSFWPGPSSVWLPVSASGQGTKNSSSQGWSERYWRWSSRNSSALPPSDSAR